MPITAVTKAENRQLQNIANILATSQKMVIVTGAGISTNCGIPVSVLCLGPIPADRHRTSDPSKVFMLLSRRATTRPLRPFLRMIAVASWPVRPTVPRYRSDVKQAPCRKTLKGRIFSTRGSGKIQPALQSSTSSSPRSVRRFEKKSSKQRRRTAL